MKIAMPARSDNSFPGCSSSSTTYAGTHRAHGREQQNSAARQELAKFALSWVVNEPALVTQHHREWLS
jgi:hypothetical protein